ncbi:MAG: DUF4363 family protein [Clostridia bacterium]|nr:DUF4363 family protein [Clostridia bacterium]
MNTRIFAYIIFTVIIISVFTNTVVLQRQISEVICEVEEFRITEGECGTLVKKAVKLYDDFKSKESYISLTVSHDDLTNIESGFAELIGYLSADEFGSAVATKNRLLDSLEHLRRLSGINFEAII